MTRHTLENAGIEKQDVNRIMSLLKNSTLSGQLHERRDITGTFIQVREYDTKEALGLIMSKTHHEYVKKYENLLKTLDIH